MSRQVIRRSAPLPDILPNDVIALKKLKETLENDMGFMQHTASTAVRSVDNLRKISQIKADCKTVSKALSRAMYQQKKRNMAIATASELLPVELKRMMPALSGPMIITPLAKRLGVDVSTHPTNPEQIEEIVKQPIDIIRKELLLVISSLNKNGLNSVLKKLISHNVISVGDVKFNESNPNKKKMIWRIIVQRFLRDPSKRNPLGLLAKPTSKISEYLAAKKKTKRKTKNNRKRRQQKTARR